MRQASMKKLRKEFDLGEGKKLVKGLTVRAVKTRDGRTVPLASNPYNNALRKVKKEARTK